MPADVDAIRVAAVLCAVAVEPGDGLPVLAHDLVHVHFRRQVVVVDHRHHTVRAHALRHVAAGGLVQRIPVAAVHEHVDRRARARSREDVNGLLGERAECHVEVPVQLDPGLVAELAPGVETRLVIREALAIVVLRVERFLIQLSVDQRCGHRPSQGRCGCRRRAAQAPAGCCSRSLILSFWPGVGMLEPSARMVAYVAGWVSSSNSRSSE